MSHQGKIVGVQPRAAVSSGVCDHQQQLGLLAATTRTRPPWIDRSTPAPRESMEIKLVAGLSLSIFGRGRKAEGAACPFELALASARSGEEARMKPSERPQNASQRATGVWPKAPLDESEGPPPSSSPRPLLASLLWRPPKPRSPRPSTPRPPRSRRTAASDGGTGRTPPPLAAVLGYAAMHGRGSEEQRTAAGATRGYPSREGRGARGRSLGTQGRPRGPCVGWRAPRLGPRRGALRARAARLCMQNE